MTSEHEEDRRSGRLDQVLDRGIRATHRLGLRSLSSYLAAIETMRSMNAHHSGARDAEENARTEPPKDERIELHSVWMVEVHPPSSSASLGKALRRLPQGGIYRDQDLAEEVARARRYPLGGWWWNLGVFHQRGSGGRMPGEGTMDLPNHVDHLFLTMHLLTPSLACSVAQFVLDDEGASKIESILRKRYTTEGVRKPHGAVGVRDPLTFKRDLVAASLDGLHDGCKAWFRTYLPGAFCDGLLEEYLPTCYFLTLDQVRPLSEEARLGYLDPVGIDAGHSALVSEELPGLRLSSPTGVNRRPHTFHLAGKRDELFPDDRALGGHGRGRGGFTVALHMRLNRFMAMWGLERALLGYEMAFGRLRDSFAETHASSIRKNLAALGVASSNVAKLGGDAQAVASDALRLTGDQRAFERELVTFEPVQPELWRIEGNWTELMRDDIGLSAERVRQIESAARDLELTRASIVSSRTNLSLQASLRRLTVFLIVLTIVLVAIGWRTLQVMD